MNGRAQAVLDVRSLSKTFVGQRALDDVQLSLWPGRIHALVGHNGSGKSTLIKILAGYHSPDAGADVRLRGEPIQVGSQRAAVSLGMRFVHQDLGLIDDLDTVDNLALGRGYSSRWWISHRREEAGARSLLEEMGIDLDVGQPVGELVPVERTMVAIARALGDFNGDERPTILVLDEPSESLTGPEVERLFAAIRRVSGRGTAVLYVSHRLDEVLAIADEVTVLKDGAVVAHEQAAALDHDRLLKLIVGRELQVLEHARPAASGEVAMAVAGLTAETCAGVSFEVRRGEILGVAGLIGSGRSELPHLLGGARPWSGGTVEMAGAELSRLTPAAALRAGVVLVPGDRQRESTLPQLSLRENVTLPRVPCSGPLRWIANRQERREAKSWMERTGVVPNEPERLLATLSGGNQQKAVLARALRCEPRVLVLDEPVQGVDVGARAAIFQLLLEAAAAGTAIVVASSEPEDLVALCDRILVMQRGRIVSTLAGGGMSADRVVEQTLAEVPGAAGRG